MKLTHEHSAVQFIQEKKYHYHLFFALDAKNYGPNHKILHGAIFQLFQQPDQAKLYGMSETIAKRLLHFDRDKLDPRTIHLDEKKSSGVIVFPSIIDGIKLADEPFGVFSWRNGKINIMLFTKKGAFINGGCQYDIKTAETIYYLPDDFPKGLDHIEIHEDKIEDDRASVFAHCNIHLNFLLYLEFAKEIFKETIPTGRKKDFRKNVSVTNYSGVPIEFIDAKYDTTVTSGPFSVEGFFRKQPIGKRGEGRFVIKWIDGFVKSGYNRKAKIAEKHS